MKKAILFLFLAVFSFYCYGTTYYSISNGDFQQASNWSPAQVPNLADTSTHVHLFHDMTIPLNGQYNCKGHLTIYTYASLFTPNQFRVNGGHVIVWGYLNVHNNLWMENGGVMEVWYGGFVFVDNKITYNEISTIYLRGGTICWHNLWKGGPPEGVGVLFNDPHLPEIDGCYLSTGPLGVSLVSFETRCSENYTELFWVTENEENNDYFTLEKSRDLISWHFVTDYPGQLHSSGRTEYRVTDDELNPGVWYYRLSQTDINGNRTFFEDSWIRYSDCYPDKDDLIYPNPVKDILTVFNSAEVQGTIRIVDALGSEHLRIKGGNPLTRIYVQSLKPGVYFLVLADNQVIKFIKE
ncbi:MAG: T9SS type A sorting domain-containing protein [Bacteroidales bacterium]